MLEISVITTDQTFVKDLNSAGIEGVQAESRPTMAFDSTEHIQEIVVMALTSTGLKLAAEWLVGRLKKDPSKQIIVNNQTINNNNADNIVIIFNNYTDTHGKDKD